jgi:Cellulase (glycosyl hydrolase family 5)/Bacterial Ig domain
MSHMNLLAIFYHRLHSAASITLSCGLAISLLCSSVSGAASLTPTIGLNKFDLFAQYQGVASGGDGGPRYQRVTQAMGRKAIADAHGIGVAFLRISATGYAPSVYGKPGDLDLWRRDPATYWALFDQMMADLQANGMRAVLTMVWNPSQFPAMTGETTQAMMRNPASKSYSLLSQYVTEIATRYRSHPALMFYELTNEMNLSADIDSVGYCRRGQPAPQCEPLENYTTDDLVAFTGRLAGLIRKIDPAHPISSGFSIPRMNAEGLRENPEWKAGKSAPADTREQFEHILRDANQAADVISVHLYGTENNRRFRSDDAVTLLAEAKRAADHIGKPLFVGEFGDDHALTAGPNSFSARMLREIVALRIPYSAVWVWEFYQSKPNATHDSAADNFSLEPGYTDQLIEKLKHANIDLGNPIPAPKRPDTASPNVVLTWPLECAQLQPKQDLYAVASGDRGELNRVAFWLDGKKLGQITSLPYKFELNAGNLPRGEHEIVARAVDMAERGSEWKTKVLIGEPAPGSFCASAAAHQH